jgi:hypothetical protein
VTSIATRYARPSAGSRALFDRSSPLLCKASLLLGRSNLLSYSPSNVITASPPFSFGGKNGH